MHTIFGIKSNRVQFRVDKKDNRRVQGEMLLRIFVTYKEGVEIGAKVGIFSVDKKECQAINPRGVLPKFQRDAVIEVKNLLFENCLINNC